MLQSHYTAEDVSLLLERLERRERRQRRLFLGLLIGLGIVCWAVQRRLAWELGTSLNLVLALPSLLVLVLYVFYAGHPRQAQPFEKILQLLQQSPASQPLVVYLQLYFLCDANTSMVKNELRTLCREHLGKRLLTVTVGELELLTPQERRRLVHLLYEQPKANPLTTLISIYPPPLAPKERELQLGILLALGTLRHPGGEKAARRILRGSKDEALQEAARDYLSAT